MGRRLGLPGNPPGWFLGRALEKCPVLSSCVPGTKRRFLTENSPLASLEDAEETEERNERKRREGS
jgi:hypothetical protein